MGILVGVLIGIIGAYLEKRRLKKQLDIIIRLNKELDEILKTIKENKK
jgi:uncharacterized membrane-anchored protein YhcB (DUF1043 family)